MFSHLASCYETLKHSWVRCMLRHPLYVKISKIGRHIVVATRSKSFGPCLIRSSNCLPFASTRVQFRFFGGGPCYSYATFQFFVLSYYVFTFRVSCCNVCYDFLIKTMFGSSLPPVVCRRVRVLFTLFVGIFVVFCYSGV